VSGGFFNTFFTEPLYNGLVFLISSIPAIDVGVAIIIFTILVRLLLFPLSKKAIETQIAMKRIEPELAELKKRFKGNLQAQGQATFELYRRHKIKPFSSFLLILVQLPIIFALYKIFVASGLPAVDFKALYSFTPAPSEVNIIFLGLIDITKRSLPLALLAGISQFAQAKFALPPPKPRSKSDKPSFSEDFAHGMHIQMSYVFPIITFAITYSISGAVALYWTTSNIFSVFQEIFVRRRPVEPPAAKGNEGGVGKQT